MSAEDIEKLAELLKEKQADKTAKGWLRANGGWALTLILLSLQIWHLTGSPIYSKASALIDTVWSNNRQVHEVQGELSIFKVDQHEVDSAQNHNIEKLIAKQP